MNRFSGILTQRTFHGGRSVLSIEVGTHTLAVDVVSSRSKLGVGDRVEGALDPQALRWLPERDEEESACAKAD
jgi:hypothetical protein